MTRQQKLLKQAKRLDVEIPIGSRVKYWPGAKVGAGRDGTVVSEFMIVGDMTVVAKVSPDNDWIPASHIQRGA